jgi:iron complex transport system substrate-binding protein
MSFHLPRSSSGRPFKAPPFSCRQGLGIALVVLILTLLFFTRPAGAVAPGTRILSLSPAATEMVYKLGLENRLVGVTTYCNYPPAAKQKPRVGAALDLNEEMIMALKPDLILTTEGDKARYARLGQLTRASVVTLSTRQVDDIWRDMRLIGEHTNMGARANREVGALQTRLKRVVADLPKRRTPPSVFYMVWDKPLMTAGPNSYLGDLITLAGGRNVVAAMPGNAYPPYSWEAFLAKDPQVILGPQNMAASLQALKTKYPHLQAVKSGRVRALPDDLISRPGPRVVEALEAVAAALR